MTPENEQIFAEKYTKRGLDRLSHVPQRWFRLYLLQHFPERTFLGNEGTVFVELLLGHVLRKTTRPHPELLQLRDMLMIGGRRAVIREVSVGDAGQFLLSEPSAELAYDLNTVARPLAHDWGVYSSKQKVPVKQ